MRGIIVGYHNHWWEFAGGDDPLYAVFERRLEPFVTLQLDTYWAHVGRQSAPALLSSLGNRVSSLHLKDGPVSKDEGEHVAVGDGSMPVLNILRAVPGALRVIELDGYRTRDVFEPVERSYRFLRQAAR